MSLEDTIQQILSAHPNLKREDIIKKIEEKKRKFGKYFTDVVLARIVASEMGIEATGAPIRERNISIQDLVSGLNDVTVIGRVLAVYPVRCFKRRDGVEGKVARLLIGDKTGKLRVVLWDEHASGVEQGKIEKDSVIRILHGYVREGRDGKLELHVGSRGKIEDVSGEDYSNLVACAGKIGDLSEGDKHVTVQGIVVTKPLFKEVTTSRGERVPVVTFELKDETGRIWVSAWRKLAETARKLRVGSRVRVKDGYVKKGFADQLEISSHAYTSIEVLKAEAEQKQ